MGMKRFLFVLIAAVLTCSVCSTAQNNRRMEEITAIALYDAFRTDANAAKDKYGMKTLHISGIAVKVGPDVYGLPSVEVASKAGESCKALCVLPFLDYLKLRKVSKGDRVVIKGEVRGYTSEYDLVVVKQSEIVSVNGKKP